MIKINIECKSLIMMTKQPYSFFSINVWVQLYTLIQLRFNPIHFVQYYTYFKQLYQECSK